MVRTRISLDPERHAQAQARAAAQGTSLAEYVRRLIDRDLAEQARRVDRSVVFDLGTSRHSDIASDKARMMGEATATGKRRHAATP